jgi:hypothetical protein
MTATTKKAGTKQRKDRADAADNMRVWNAVCHSDPKHIKKVNQRGGFHAICAPSQRHAATRLWGPEGERWEVSATPGTMEVGDTTLAIVDLQLKWREKVGDEWLLCQPQRGASVLSAKGRIDTDAWKKAGTDALTKSLAGLGFNADVFLGKFDDNKYIEQQREKFIKPFEEAAKIQNATASIKAIIDIQPLYELLVIIDCDTWSSKTKEQVSNTFAGRAEKEGVPFDAAFIKAQCEQAQAKIDSMEQDT